MMELGRFELDLGMRRLLRDGEAVRVGSRAFDILAAIAAAGGRLVTRDELMKTVWPGSIVEEGNIDVNLSALRKALGPDRDLIITVPGRGYQLAQVPVKPLPARSVVRVGLPARRVSLVGREAVIGQLCAALADAPVLTLTGTGGVGKTSLAIEVAHRMAGEFDNHFAFVELATLNTREAVLQAIMTCCGLPAENETPGLAALTTELARTPRLLLLDSAEHVIGAVAEIVEPLLAASATLRVLVTSREPLRIRPEALFKVDPLATPTAQASDAEMLQSPAVELFRQRANALPAGVGAENHEIQLIGEICRRLDGIPLAIELAAARVDVLGVEGVRRRLDDRLAILTGGYRTAMPRHQTLRATFDASFTLLGDVARCLFQRLAIFNTPFTFDSMRAVVCDAALTEDDVIDGIGELVAKSLVNVSLDGSEAVYRLFESTRAYAADKLRGTEDVRQIASRHARFVAALIDAHDERDAITVAASADLLAA